MRELIKSLTSVEQHHRYYIFNTFTGKVLGKGQAPLLYVLSVRVCPVSRRQGWCFHHSCILAFVCRQDFPAKPAAKGLCRACFLILGPNQVVGFAFSGSPASLFSLSLLCLPQPGIAVFMTLPMRPSGWKMKSASLMSCFGRGILQLIVILPLIWVIPICIIYTAGFVYTPRNAQGACVFRRENHPRETLHHQGQTCFLVYDLKAENVCPVLFFPPVLCTGHNSPFCACWIQRAAFTRSLRSQKFRPEQGEKCQSTDPQQVPSSTCKARSASGFTVLLPNALEHPLDLAKSILLIEENDNLQTLMVCPFLSWICSGLRSGPMLIKRAQSVRRSGEETINREQPCLQTVPGRRFISDFAEGGWCSEGLRSNMK